MLIVAREFAAQLAVPVLISDAEGRLVYFNEAAEEVVGQSFAEAGELPASEYASIFSITDEEGRPLDSGELPSSIALQELKPTHGTLNIVGLDDVGRAIEVTAIPLLARRDEPVGVMRIFWPVS